MREDRLTLNGLSKNLKFSATGNKSMSKKRGSRRSKACEAYEQRKLTSGFGEELNEIKIQGISHAKEVGLGQHKRDNRKDCQGKQI